MALNNNNKTSNNNETEMVVRVDQDSETNLKALFDSVLKPSDSSRPLQVPLRMRNLPNSFFNPPPTGSKSSSVNHSRENSDDSAFGSGSTLQSNRLISHSRAHSSPATLQDTYSLSQNNNNNTLNLGQKNHQQSQPANSMAHLHIKQRSYDITSSLHMQAQQQHRQQQQQQQQQQSQQQQNVIVDDLNDIPLPEGFEQARTASGQIYYLNHLTRTTQWEDPRKQIQAQQQAALAEQHRTQSLLGSQNIQQQQQQTLDNVGPLSDEWLEACTTNGTPFYVNRNKGTTSWSHPRLPNTIPAISQKITPAAISNSLGPLPEGWEQAATTAGEIYFINHINRTTSWYDPRIPEELQRIRSTPAPTDMISTFNSGSWSNIRLLEREREDMKQRQLEIKKQGLLLRQNPQQQMELDPFLSDHSNTDHARQESADSGLSLSSNNVSLPHYSDFLTNIDDMDCLSEVGNLDSIGGDLNNADDLMSSFQLAEGLLDVNLSDVNIINNI